MLTGVKEPKSQDNIMKQGEVLRATVPDEEFFLSGEAKGLAWASHAAAGGQMAPNTNPYVSPRIIARLLTMGEKAKLEKEI